MTAENIHVDRTGMIRLSGILVPSKWDQDGNITRISLQSDDDREWLISPDSQNYSGLSGLLTHAVRLEGYPEFEGPETCLLVVNFVLSD